MSDHQGGKHDRLACEISRLKLISLVSVVGAVTLLGVMLTACGSTQRAAIPHYRTSTPAEVDAAHTKILTSTGSSDCTGSGLFAPSNGHHYPLSITPPDAFAAIEQASVRIDGNDLVATIETSGSINAAAFQKGDLVGWLLNFGHHGLTDGTIEAFATDGSSVPHATVENYDSKTPNAHLPGAQVSVAGAIVVLSAPLSVIPRLSKSFTWTVAAASATGFRTSRVYLFNSVCPAGKIADPSAQGFLGAKRAWVAGLATAGGYLQNGPWQIARDDLKQIARTKHAPKATARAISSLANLMTLPDAMLSPAQLSQQQSDLSELDAYFGVGDLYQPQASTTPSVPATVPAETAPAVSSVGGEMSAQPLSSTPEQFAGTLAEELQAGSFPGAAAIPDAVVSCPNLATLDAGTGFACNVTSATLGDAQIVGEIEASGGVSIRVLVGENGFACSDLTAAEQSALVSLGGVGCRSA